MSLRVLTALLLLIVLLPIVGALAVAWMDLQSSSSQPHVGERSRNDPKRRFVRTHVWRNVN
jgi:hypothetical protein